MWYILIEIEGEVRMKILALVLSVFGQLTWAHGSLESITCKNSELTTELTGRPTSVPYQMDFNLRVNDKKWNPSNIQLSLEDSQNGKKTIENIRFKIENAGDFHLKIPEIKASKRPGEAIVSWHSGVAGASAKPLKCLVVYK